MMIVLGLSLGVYYLLEKHELTAPSLRGPRAAILTRALIVAGLIIGGTAASGAYGFELAAFCVSKLSVFVPWTVYWTGLFLAVGLLVGTYQFVSEKVALRGLGE
jgi:hypothetical protein